MFQVFGDALNLKFQGTFIFHHPLLMTWPSSLYLTYKIINRRKTNFISKIIVFIKIKRVVEKWSLRSKSIHITGTNLVVTRMIIFLWFNIFHRLQTKNMCRVFNGFNQGLDFSHHFLKVVNNSMIIDTLIMPTSSLSTEPHNPFLDFSWLERNLV